MLEAPPLITMLTGTPEDFNRLSLDAINDESLTTGDWIFKILFHQYARGVAFTGCEEVQRIFERFARKDELEAGQKMLPRLVPFTIMKVLQHQSCFSPSTGLPLMALSECGEQHDDALCAALEQAGAKSADRPPPHSRRTSPTTAH